jgi:hypothetical protein
MQLYRNSRLIKRNKTLGRIMMFGGLGASFAAVIIVFVWPSLVSLALVLMLSGGFFSQLGTNVFKRFGTSPRIDQVIDDSLKGLGDHYGMFHYYLGTDHALVAPAGVFALLPRDEQGEIRYETDRWMLTPAKRRFGRGPKPIKGIERDARRDGNALTQSIARGLPDSPEVSIVPLVVFIANDTTVAGDNAPVPAVHLKKLKAFIRRQERQKSLSPEEIRELAENLKIVAAEEG